MIRHVTFGYLIHDELLLRITALYKFLFVLYCIVLSCLDPVSNLQLLSALL